MRRMQVRMRKKLFDLMERKLSTHIQSKIRKRRYICMYVYGRTKGGGGREEKIGTYVITLSCVILRNNSQVANTVEILQSLDKKVIANH